jgi:four helix bundle protein
LEGEPIKSYRDLEVYRRSLGVLVSVHRMLLGFPVYEQRELASQIRRASKSVPMNIAEGYGKKRSAKDFRSFLDIAMGSANEVVVSLEIAKLLGYASCEECDALMCEYEIIGKQLNRLSQAWR